MIQTSAILPSRAPRVITLCAAHFGHMPLGDVLGNVVSLGASLLLGIALMLPGPRPIRSAPSKARNTEQEGRG